MISRSTITFIAVVLAGCSLAAERAPLQASGLSIAGNPAISDDQFSRYVEQVAISAASLKTDEGMEYDFHLELLVSDKGQDDIDSVHVNFGEGRRFKLPKQATTTFTEGREHEASYGRHDEVDGFVWSYIDIDTDDIEDYLTGDIVLELHHASGIASLGLKLVESDGGEGSASFPAAPQFKEPILSGLSGDDLTLQIVPAAYDAYVFLGREDPSSEDFTDVIEDMIPAGQSVYAVSDLSAGHWGGDIMATRVAEGEVQGVGIEAHLASGVTVDFEAEK